MHVVYSAITETKSKKKSKKEILRQKAIALANALPQCKGPSQESLKKLRTIIYLEVDE